MLEDIEVLSSREVMRRTLEARRTPRGELNLIPLPHLDKR